MAKLIIKELPETKENGTAGKVIQSVVRKENVGDGCVLTVLVWDGAGGLMPVTLPQSQTEIRRDL